MSLTPKERKTVYNRYHKEISSIEDDDHYGTYVPGYAKDLDPDMYGTPTTPNEKKRSNKSVHTSYVLGISSYTNPTDLNTAKRIKKSTKKKGSSKKTDTQSDLIPMKDYLQNEENMSNFDFEQARVLLSNKDNSTSYIEGRKGTFLTSLNIGENRMADQDEIDNHIESIEHNLFLSPRDNEKDDEEEGGEEEEKFKGRFGILGGNTFDEVKLSPTERFKDEYDDDIRTYMGIPPETKVNFNYTRPQLHGERKVIDMSDEPDQIKKKKRKRKTGVKKNKSTEIQEENKKVDILNPKSSNSRKSSMGNEVDFEPDESLVQKDFDIHTYSRKIKDHAKILLLQSQPRSDPQSNALFLDETLARVEGPIDLIVLPEYWLANEEPSTIQVFNPTKSNVSLMEMSKIVKKYNCYALLGSMKETGTSMEENDKPKIYMTSVLLGRNGQFVGKYRKQLPQTFEFSSGNEPGIFDTQLGRIGVLLCYDIEDKTLLNQTLAYKPDIIINPVYIPSRQSLMSQQHHLHSWKVALEISANNVEKLCAKHKCTVIRCDQPYRSVYSTRHGSAMGSSQVIGPFRTVVAPSYTECVFKLSIPLKHQENYRDWKKLLRPCKPSRSEAKFNTGHRFTIYSLKPHTDSVVDFKVIQDGERLISGSSDGRIQIYGCRTLEFIDSIEAHQGGVVCLENVENGIISCGNDRKIKSWDLETAKAVKTYHFDIDKRAFPTCFQRLETDPMVVAYGDSKGNVTLWDVRVSPSQCENRCIPRLHHKLPILNIRSHHHQLFVHEENGFQIGVYDVRKLDDRVTRYVTKSTVRSISSVRQYGDEDYHLAVCTDKGIERFYVGSSNQLLSSFFYPHYKQRVSACEFINDEHLLTAFDDSLRICNIEKNFWCPLDFTEGVLSGVQSFRLFGNNLVIGDSSGTIKWLSFTSNKLKANFQSMFTA